MGPGRQREADAPGGASTNNLEEGTLFNRHLPIRGLGAAALGLSLTATAGLAVAASTPELPPNAHGYVALCPDAASGGLQTLIVSEADAEAAMTEGTVAAPCAVAPGADASGPMLDAETGIHVGELGDGLYWMTEGVYQVMFATTGEGVIVVDAPPSIGGERIVAGIASVTDEPITHVIYSHTHADHIGAAGAYPADATYIAHADTAAQLEQSLQNEFWGAFVGGGPIPLPTETFDDAMTLTVGTQTLELSTPAALSHEPGNIFVYAPSQNVLLHIDIVFPGWSPFKDMAQAEDVPGYLAVHDEILAFGADSIVTGHLGRLGTNADVALNQEYMGAIATAASNALQSTDPSSIGAATGSANTWLFFDTYLDQLTAACEAEVVPQWTDRLAAADIFTADHCYKMYMSLRID
jgi:glyoxylase-like metal-dependent hydrolase (beta-lactamase superfamily II)